MTAKIYATSKHFTHENTNGYPQLLRRMQRTHGPLFYYFSSLERLFVHWHSPIRSYHSHLPIFVPYYLSLHLYLSLTQYIFLIPGNAVDRRKLGYVKVFDINFTVV